MVSMFGRTRLTTLFLSTAIMFLVASWASAHAEGSTSSEASKQEAKKSFEHGVELFNEEDYTGALAEFLSAYKAQSHFNVLYNIAQCHYEIENNAEALAYFELYRRRDHERLLLTWSLRSVNWINHRGNYNIAM